MNTPRVRRLLKDALLSWADLYLEGLATADDGVRYILRNLQKGEVYLTAPVVRTHPVTVRQNDGSVHTYPSLDSVILTQMAHRLAVDPVATSVEAKAVSCLRGLWEVLDSQGFQIVKKEPFQ